MKKTNASDIEEKKNEQLSIKSIELLKDTIGYNEFAEFYKLLFEKNNNGIEKKIAAIVSVCTLFFWICKAIYFSYLPGVNFYYGISNEYIHINDNLGYQIFQFITGVLIFGFVTIIFMNIWLAQTCVIKKIFKSIVLALIEMLVVCVGVCLYTYGTQPMKAVEEIKNYSRSDISSLVILLVCMWLVVHCYGILTLISRRTADKNKICEKESQKKKERKRVLLKSNISMIFIFSVIIAVGAWFFGWINEMHRTEYNVVVCSSFDEETTEQEYIFENDDKRYIAYVVIGDADDYFLCKRLTNKGTISNIQSFIKKEGTELFSVRNHFDKTY